MNGEEDLARNAAVLLGLPGITPAQTLALTRTGDPVEIVAQLRTSRIAPSKCLPREVLIRWQGWLAGERPRAIAATAMRRGAFGLVRGVAGWPLRDEPPDGPDLLLGEGTRRDALARPRVAIVGTRSATPHGLRDAHDLAAGLAEAGVTIVSGLAVGIDGAAHAGAVHADGLTVAVVATGLDVVYPRRHRALYEEVHARGVWLTEYGYGTKPARWRFPVRNRVIAALADVVVVVEATERGGARITAEHALRYGRSVLAMPGSRRNAAAAGCNQLIADGAHPLLDVDDVVLALGLAQQPPSSHPAALMAADPDAGPVLRALGGEPATLDDVCDRLREPPAKIAAAVARLVRAGVLVRDQGLLWPV